MWSGLSCVQCGQNIHTDDVSFELGKACCRHCGADFRLPSHLTDEIPVPAVDLSSTPPDGVSYDRSQAGFRIRARAGNLVAIIVFIPEAVLATIAWMTGWVAFCFGLAMVNVIWLCWIAAGHVQVACRGNEFTVLRGIGPIGWTRRAEWGRVKSFRLREISTRRQRGLQIEAELVNGQQIGFGCYLTADRRAFMAAALRRELAERPPTPPPLGSPR